MTLTVEDGTLVAGADSYISLEDAREYATSRGITLNATDGTAEVQLRKAFDYIEAMRTRFQGEKSDETQESQWPRSNVFIDGIELDDDVIPSLLKYAQVHYAAAIEGGLDIMPTETGEAFVTREKIGPIDTEYSQYVRTSGIPTVRTGDALIAPLLVSRGTLTTVRA